MKNNRKKEITRICISYTFHKYLKLIMAYVELTVIKSTLPNTVPALTDCCLITQTRYSPLIHNFSFSLLNTKLY